MLACCSLKALQPLAPRGCLADSSESQAHDNSDVVFLQLTTQPASPLTGSDGPGHTVRNFPGTAIAMDSCLVLGGGFGWKWLSAQAIRRLWRRHSSHTYFCSARFCALVLTSNRPYSHDLRKL